MFGKLDKNSYIPLCILEYIKKRKHYDLLYYNEDFKDDSLIVNISEINKTEKNIIKKDEQKIF